MKPYARERATALALLAVLVILFAAAPSFYSAANLRDLALKNVAPLVAAIGMTLVIIIGQIDISIGAQFAISGVILGVLARDGVPVPVAATAAVLGGAAMGAINGALVARAGMPSIVATLATMSLLRDALRWATEGAWVQNLPAGFQWAGFGQTAGRGLLVFAALFLLVSAAWMLRHLSGARAFFAVGANPETARLAGLPTRGIVFAAFTLMGLLSGTAAVLNAVRFNEIPANPNNGLELQVIAAVVVGGASLSGGRATLLGTALGVVLLGIIGTALTFLGVNPYWEKAVQGGIILIAGTAAWTRRGRAVAA